MSNHVLGLVGALCAVGCLVACGDDEGADPNAANRAAAIALAKVVTFDSGTRVAGLLPDTTVPSVLLTGSDAVATPGMATLLDFEADLPSGESAAVALLEFDGADDHFELLVDNPTVVGTQVTFSAMMMTPLNACDTLCNTEFDLQLAQALKLASGGVGEHMLRDVKLDCRAHGDPSLCASAVAPGDTAGTGATGEGSALETRLCPLAWQCNFRSEQELPMAQYVEMCVADARAQPDYADWTVRCEPCVSIDCASGVRPPGCGTDCW
jgi:hypothetical protein